uniref:ribonuclease H n=1 Tax=Monopterus albus TaxID=43700 RepID=A0A3Q3IL89_MONAL
PHSKRTTSVIGFSSLKEEWPFSEAVPCRWNNLSFHHLFLLSPSCPVNLLARDILCSLNVTMMMSSSHCLLHRNHNKENIDHPLTRTLLDSLPSSLWSTGPTDMGLITVDPVRITLREGAVPVYRAQYPLTPQQVSGIEKTIHGLLGAGVLTPTHSSWNTPINPVPKAGKPDYRMVHDLRAINKLVVPTDYATPNPYTMLNAISSEHKFFTCIDLANAFFSVPLHNDSQIIFAFTYKGQQFTYRRLPMGFIDSPLIFNHILRQNLKNLSLPAGVCFLQYVDDLLLAAPDSESIMIATDALLTHLAQGGFKVSKDKLQIGRPRVAFLAGYKPFYRIQY